MSPLPQMAYDLPYMVWGAMQGQEHFPLLWLDSTGLEGPEEPGQKVASTAAKAGL